MLRPSGSDVARGELTADVPSARVRQADAEDDDFEPDDPDDAAGAEDLPDEPDESFVAPDPDEPESDFVEEFDADFFLTPSPDPEPDPDSDREPDPDSDDPDFARLSLR